MSSSFSTGWCVPGWNFDTCPYIAGILRQFRQGDSAVWTDTPFIDRTGIQYDSTGYTLKYTLAGPVTVPVVLTAIAKGQGWQTTLDTTTSANLTFGLYSWQVQAFATNVRMTLDEGELTVEPDLLSVGANYDGRSQAQIALSQAKTAFATFSQSGGRVRSYTIGHRSMTFDNLQEVQAQVNFWKGEVEKEQMLANRKRRFVNVRLDRTR